MIKLSICISYPKTVKLNRDTRLAKRYENGKKLGIVLNKRLTISSFVQFKRLCINKYESDKPVRTKKS